MVLNLGSTSPDLPSRASIENIIVDWKRSSIPLADPTPSDEDWVVDWSKSPFRLLAIVNRLDLRANPSIQNAGEGRFVFCVIDQATGSPFQFNIIFEYLQPANSEAEVLAVAHRWHELGNFASFDQAYLDKLVEITKSFAGKNALPTGPNGNALSQIRTNEVHLSSPWELREFHLFDGGLLRPERVALTPRDGLDNSSVLGLLLDLHGPDAGAFPQQLLDVRALTPFNFEWRARNVVGDPMPRTDTVLRKFSVNTCNGCHGTDGAAFDGLLFVHVEPRQQGSASRLSRFLTGVHPFDPNAPVSPVIDPGSGASLPAFSDLENRAKDMAFLLDTRTDNPSRMLQASTAMSVTEVESLQRLFRFREGIKIRPH